MVVEESRNVCSLANAKCCAVMQQQEECRMGMLALAAKMRAGGTLGSAQRLNHVVTRIDDMRFSLGAANSFLRTVNLVLSHKGGRQQCLRGRSDGSLG
jgi:hypothetical protein